MSASPVHVESPAPKPDVPGKEKSAAAQTGSRWQKYITPLLVVLLALAILITLTRNWNSWEGGKAEQVTDDAYVRGDLTPLSTKVAGIVNTVHVSDYQQVHNYSHFLPGLYGRISAHLSQSLRFASHRMNKKYRYLAQAAIPL